MKYRKNTSGSRVAFGFNGILQDDLEAYQGFMQVANPFGWRVIPLYENFESRLRTLVTAQAVDGVVGKFISASWLEGLSTCLPAVHLGASPLKGVPSVVPETEVLGREAATHLSACGCSRFIWYAPSRVQGVREGMEAVTGHPVEELRTQDSLRRALEQTSKTGVFCLTDFHARQVVSLGKRLQMTIPDQVCILGIGDRFWDGVVAGLGISSIPIPHQRMGEAAAFQLRDAFQGAAQSCVSIRPGMVRIRESSRLEKEGDELYLKVRGWLEDRLVDPPTMEEMAGKAGMSRRGFERAFAKIAGTTPYEFLLQLRTEESLRLLKETEWTISRVGAAVGIPDPSRFSAFLKKRTGKCPTACKQMALD